MESEEFCDMAQINSFESIIVDDDDFVQEGQELENKVAWKAFEHVAHSYDPSNVLLDPACKEDDDDFGKV